MSTWLDTYRVVPRAIAIALSATAIVLTWRIVNAVLEGGIESNGELAALSGIITAMVVGSTSVVAMLGKAESK